MTYYFIDRIISGISSQSKCFLNEHANLYLIDDFVLAIQISGSTILQVFVLLLRDRMHSWNNITDFLNKPLIK